MGDNKAHTRRFIVYNFDLIRSFHAGLFWLNWMVVANIYSQSFSGQIDFRKSMAYDVQVNPFFCSSIHMKEKTFIIKICIIRIIFIDENSCVHAWTMTFLILKSVECDRIPFFYPASY